MAEGHFEVLDAAECSLLLREQAVGRVAFQGPDGLTVLPLSYLLADEKIVLRTARDTQLAALPEQTPVAFEVDEFDAGFRNGWSVLVRGQLHRAGDEDLASHGPMPEPFVPDDREQLLVITPREYTGRAVSSD
ncbi:MULTISPECIES: pyridoxamine 5'-phosphate oxidase family protein [unclassified Luteococcus]|uniref:pyridoxamine 5'-phosphate oxidase family protein n=1 Tax=unclassified Luteococcus TaxID=2639923 RepID=UPI00313C421D